MKHLISYTTFSNHAELEEWQENNPEMIDKIISIVPLSQSVNFEQSSSTTAKADVSIGCLVVYVKNIVAHKDTVSVYAFGKDSQVVDTLISYEQEEHMCEMQEVLNLLNGSELDEFKEEVDTTCSQCLLVRSW